MKRFEPRAISRFPLPLRKKQLVGQALAQRLGVGFDLVGVILHILEKIGR